MPKETLNFKIVLDSTYWDNIPEYSVAVNSQEYASGVAKNKKSIEFTCDLDEEGEHILEIKLLNKSNNDTVENEDKTAIIKDMLLNIESIEIDGIELAQLKWSASEFVPEDASRPILQNCVNLGWNGSYKLKFTTPFYLWLLEKM